MPGMWAEVGSGLLKPRPRVVMILGDLLTVLLPLVIKTIIILNLFSGVGECVPQCPRTAMLGFISGEFYFLFKILGNLFGASQIPIRGAWVTKARRGHIFVFYGHC